ncbi:MULTISPECIES: UTP--glucose-1-phosphate uridylyltransferase GalU [Larkinella]|jgi:UTP--glucose-1-phosphate uridylyltransferase|uniref:UTP--glucose-1-phosphate uridylyltransferase n=2 Tax=Larkinella TaxID=332157 RepID=A0A5N1JP10_9BACT|nr:MULTISPECIES: UTP--glucose-1-phosphate uridylyltransferase GalU [Larkinella]KAA9357578.1 UTP--glucose-1-phosphate uridylyltransferase GalU [Larkinella humicola]RCR69741.1 UTP--glucose-1-phosphate uridylyltransferase [Larkinella punicea]
MIKKAVIPAAGLGTRFLPATKAQPKEMLPIIDTPTIQYVVQEAVDSGIEDILIITGKGKRSIEDHFDRNYELETRLEEKEDEALLLEMRRLSDMADIHFVRQKELNGLGDAIYYARHHVGNEPFAVLLGDTIMDSVIPVTQQLIDTYDQYRGTVIAVEEVPADKVNRYGIVGGTALSDSIMELNTLIEKPSIKAAPSNLAIAGRYILTPDIFAAIEQTAKGKNNEIQLTDAMLLLLKRENIYSHRIEGKRHDIGNKLDFLKTTVEFALKRKEFSAPFLAFLKEIVAAHS